MVEFILHYHGSVIADVQCFTLESAMQASTLALEGSLVDPTVLLIEADGSAVRTVSDGLTQAGMQVVSAQDGAAGATLVTRLRPDIVLVGLRLPDMDSVTLVGQLVGPRDCGVIVLAEAQDEAARIASLEAGADDYLAGPASVQNMVARVRAVHRRVNGRKGRSMPPSLDPVLVVGPIRINPQHRSVHTLDGRRLSLTSAEYTAFEILVRANGVVVSRDCLSEAAFHRRWHTEDRSVDQLVFGLRQKLPTDEDGNALIKSVRGTGYWLRAPEPPAPLRLEFAWSAIDPNIEITRDYHIAA